MMTTSSAKEGIGKEPSLVISHACLVACDSAAVAKCMHDGNHWVVNTAEY